jgi:RNA polymerase sigma-70 factor (ECF subfamily)
VLLEAPGTDYYLTAVRVLGSRYGTAAPPDEDFHVWLCDAQFREIADFPFPYSTFAKGEPQEVVLDVEPTPVPRRFVICIGFNPTSTKGVYMYHDREGSGRSSIGLPGRRGSRFDAGDWLIRAVVDAKSGAPAAAGQGEQVSSEPVELANDDGAHVSSRSLAGTGHAVLFDAPSNDCYLTAVRVLGSRYGTASPPDEDFHVWLCDAQFREIADFPFPYSTFARGEPQQVVLDVEPTRVPRRFVICIGFNPTSTKGVYMYHDKQGSGRSFMALPGRRGSRFDAGDWLIRAVVDVKSGAAAPAGQGHQVSSEPVELANDDGQTAGKRSMAGTGHAVLFTAPGSNWRLTGVRIYGSRYGTASPPKENFHVWLCDANFREIADFPFPYSTFTKGDPQDVILDVKPTRVPRRFVICVGFNPTRTKGVLVHHDRQGSGKSYMALPGRQGSHFDTGDWLIRAIVEQMSEAPLTDQAGEDLLAKVRAFDAVLSSGFTVEGTVVDIPLHDAVNSLPPIKKDYKLSMMTGKTAYESRIREVLDWKDIMGPGETPPERTLGECMYPVADYLLLDDRFHRHYGLAGAPDDIPPVGIVSRPVTGQNGMATSGTLLIYKPERRVYDPTIRQRLRLTGRGYSNLVEEITSVTTRPDGMLEVTALEAEGRGRWELVIDPQSAYLVCQATRFEKKSDTPGYFIRMTGRRWYGSLCMPEGYELALDSLGMRTRISGELSFAAAEADLEFMKRVEETMRPPFAVATNILDHRGAELKYTHVSAGEAARGEEALLVLTGHRGRALPELEGFRIDPAPGDLDGKRVLVCFWDYESRPSRMTVERLAKQADTLSKQGLVIVCIHTGDAAASSVNKWFQDRQITLPLGTVAGDFGTVRFDWGILTLPWLVLADEGGVVRAEGFRIEDLGEILAQLGPAEER